MSAFATEFITRKTRQSNGGQSDKKEGKNRKKKKGQKVDASMLGFATG